jgi:hypothetical protein
MLTIDGMPLRAEVKIYNNFNISPNVFTNGSNFAPWFKNTKYTAVYHPLYACNISGHSNDH